MSPSLCPLFSSEVREFCFASTLSWSRAYARFVLARSETHFVGHTEHSHTVRLSRKHSEREIGISCNETLRKRPEFHVSPFSARVLLSFVRGFTSASTLSWSCVNWAYCFRTRRAYNHRKKVHETRAGSRNSQIGAQKKNPFLPVSFFSKYKTNLAVSRTWLELVVRVSDFWGTH